MYFLKSLSGIFGFLLSSDCCYEVCIFYGWPQWWESFVLENMWMFSDIYIYILPAMKPPASPSSRLTSSTDRSSFVSHWPGSGFSVFGWILREIISWIRCQVIFSTRASWFFSVRGLQSLNVFLTCFFWCVFVCHSGLDLLTDSCLLVFLMKSCCLLGLPGDRLLHWFQHNLQHIQIFGFDCFLMASQ